MGYQIHKLRKPDLKNIEQRCQRIRFGEQCNIITFDQMSMNDHDIYQAIEILTDYFIEKELSPLFPFPTYILCPLKIESSEFYQIQKISELPEFYSKENQGFSDNEADRIRLVKKLMRSIDIKQNLDGLAQRAETIRELKSIDDQIRFYQELL